MELYNKIYNEIKQQILNGEIKQGAKLPSLYKTAQQYNCSKGTVIKSYELLCQSHIVFSKPQSGYYVADNFIRNADDPDNQFNMSTGNPLVESLSILDIKHCLNIAAELYAKNSSDVSLRGITSLNVYLPHHLSIDGIFTRNENIHLIQGITPILTYLTLHPFPNNKKTILIEEPSFWNYVNFLKQSDIRVLTIPRDENGIDLKLLEQYFKNEDIKFFYTIPRNHNPLGTALSYYQRKRIMELALRYNVYIIEDDYLGDTCHIPKYVPIFYFSYQRNCIYLRSSSKEFPFIRIGFAVIPDNFQQTFEDISNESYYYSYHMPSLISQATFESYLKSGLFQKLEDDIDQQIKTKLACVHQVTADWDSNIVKVIGAHSGYYFSMKIHRSINLNYFVSLLAKQSIYLTSNQNAFYHDDHFDNSIRLSVAVISIDNLPIALDRIYELAKKLAKIP